ncbi:hypothetical protein BKP56_05140 [Marinilactibacillus sp. 15R]|uniref:PTS sugar transporter subunit IIA n=1 Tax=Marinilactibacillus sp. 15R TaxID=1911586 RepID=UPI00090BA417|nr:PTS sugar transporter subunit IIA [Marinilactibacillus sp. 15R]API88709.1 hypothetical protein BKP56_05140 [Marinilactibacillus sp. 15R]
MNERIILISHSDFAVGIKSAVEMIVGKQASIEAYGLIPGEHPEIIINKVKDSIKEEDRIIILSDLVGGSMNNTAMTLLEYPNVTLIAGVNLPLAIEVALTKPQTDEEIEKVIEVAKTSIKHMKLEKIEDDFFF